MQASKQASIIRPGRRSPLIPSPSSSSIPPQRIQYRQKDGEYMAPGAGWSRDSLGPDGIRCLLDARVRVGTFFEAGKEWEEVEEEKQCV